MANEHLLTREQITAFLDAKWSAFKCEVCDQQTWMLGWQPEWPLVGLLVGDAQGSIRGNYWPTMPVVCSTCGNTKLLWLTSVTDSLEKQG